MSIAISGLTKAYIGKKSMPVYALRGIDVEFPNASMTAIMGSSGCGKTTLLNLIAGIDLPTSGSILFDDIEITKCTDTVRSQFRNRHIGYVMQNFELIESMNVAENLALPLLFSSVKVDKRALIKKNLDMVGMGGYEKRLVSRLSGGQKQRIAIARALMMNPSTILADEPTGALDSQTANEIVSLLAQLNGMGCSVIIVTHDPQVAQRCSTQYVMKDGKLLI